MADSRISDEESVKETNRVSRDKSNFIFTVFIDILKPAL
jgi:hypothetical protein